MSEDKKTGIPVILPAVMSLTLIAGILVGALYSKTGQASPPTEAQLFSESASGIFRHAFLTQLLWTGAVALGSLSVFLTPVIFLSVFCKGLFYGYTAGSLIYTYTFRGFLISGTGLFAHNFLACAILTVYGAMGASHAIESFLNRRNYAVKHKKNRRFAFESLAAFSGTAAVAACECLTAHFMQTWLTVL